MIFNFLNNNLIKRQVKRVLSHLGFVVIKNKKEKAYKDQLANSLTFIMENLKLKTDIKYLAEGIVFSKDRPIQLHALLNSYYMEVTEPVPLSILYSATGKRYEQAYNQIAKIFSDYSIKFLKEKDFKTDLVSALEKIQSDKIFFLVDDIVFINNVLFKDYCLIDTKKLTASLRLGGNIKYCYMQNVKQKQPEFIKTEQSNWGGEEKLFWKWSDAEYDWAYQLSVDGNLFSTKEMAIIAKIAVYYSPNTFEQSLQTFSEYFKDRSGVCYSSSKIVNIPMNIVQNDFANRSGNLAADKLLDIWESGKGIDISKIKQTKNVSPHEEIPIHFVKR